MPKKVLFCATVDTHFEAFHLPYLQWFKERGWEVHVAASGQIDLPYVDQRFVFSIQRTPFSKENMKAYLELKKIINENQYQIIHCHTPMGGVLTRLAARTARRNGTKVIYTAHGFHFFKGAPMLNWALYYPIERMLAHETDCLITINEEDYQLAKEHRFRAKEIRHVHGVGVNTDMYFPVNAFHRHVLRGEYGYSQDSFLMFYAAEFNENKNQQVLIRAISLLKEEIPEAKLLLAGEGPLLTQCKELAINLGVESMVEFLGYRRDVDRLLKASDMAVASSYREGLPVNVMEAMACGLPVVASMNRGHKELIQDERNGFVIEPTNINAWAEKLILMYKDEVLRNRLGFESIKVVKEKYSMDKILFEKARVYETFMEEMEERKWAVQ